jgi:uncharacterized membrane protein YhdT
MSWIYISYQLVENKTFVGFSKTYCISCINDLHQLFVILQVYLHNIHNDPYNFVKLGLNVDDPNYFHKSTKDYLIK